MFFFVSLQLLCSCSTQRLCIREHFQQIILWLEVTYQRQPTMNPVLGVLVILQIIWVKCDELHVVVRGECLGGGGGWGGSGVPDWPWGGQKPLETRSAVALHLCLLFLMFGEMPVEGLGGGSGGVRHFLGVMFLLPLRNPLLFIYTHISDSVEFNLICGIWEAVLQLSSSVQTVTWVAVGRSPSSSPLGSSPGVSCCLSRL